MTVLDQLEQLVEKALRPGVLGLPGRRIEKRCTSELAGYFKSLKVEKIAAIAGVTTDKALGQNQAKSALYNIVRKARPHLVLVLKSNLLDAITAGRKHVHIAESGPEDEPRDDHGRWSSMEGGKSSYLNGMEHGGEIGTKKEGKNVRHLLKIKGKVVGHMLVTDQGKEAVIKDVDLDQEFQGKGYGKAMYRHAIVGAKNRGQLTFRSETSAENPAGNSEQAKNVWSKLTGAEKVTDKHGNVDHYRINLKSLKESFFPEAQPFNKAGESLFDAVEWAEKQAADLVVGLDETTIELLSSAVAEGIEEQAGVDGTGRLIRDAINEMSVSRARTIASTEINRAFSTATMESLSNQAVEYKRIILSPEACPICEDNASQDPLPLDEDYDSGDGFPPFHPNCRCAITAARGPADSEEE